MDQVTIRKLTEIIHANLGNENFGVNDLALAAGMSRSTVHRKLKTDFKKSASQFIREVRLQKAMEMLQQNMATVSEISFKVGFNSPAYFNTCFHQYFGYPPGEIKKRNLLEANGTGNGDILSVEPKRGPTSHELRLLRLVHFSRKTIVILSLTILILLALTYFLYIFYLKEFGEPIHVNLRTRDKSIAVLPFKNISNNPENQYFADGVMEDILNRLCKIKELRVISRGSVETFRESSISTNEIAKKLKVQYILEGSVQRDGDKVQVIAQLIDTKHDQHIWSEKYERELFDIFFIQSSIAQNIANELQAVLSNKEIEKIKKIPTQNPEAYNLFLKGRFFWNTRSEEDLKKSKEYFEKATVTDPDYAMAFAGLADTYFAQAWWEYIDRGEGFSSAKEIVLKALDLDQNLAGAHATLGTLLCWDEWKWEESRKELLIAIELNPNYSTAHQYYSELLDILGQNEEAMEQINIALELDPYSRTMLWLKAWYYYKVGNWKESLNACQSLEEIDPDYTSIYWLYFCNYLKQKNEVKAVESLQKIMVKIVDTSGKSVSAKEIYDQSGLTGLLKWLIGVELKKSKPNNIRLARFNAILGKKREAIMWLEKAFNSRMPEIPRINTDPDFESLRNELRFRKIVKQMDLTP